jgi:hypothetical protein
VHVVQRLAGLSMQNTVSFCESGALIGEEFCIHLWYIGLW